MNEDPYDGMTPEEIDQTWADYRSDNDQYWEDYALWEGRVLNELGGQEHLEEEHGFEDAELEFSSGESHLIHAIERDSPKDGSHDTAEIREWKEQLRKLHVSRDYFRINQQVFASLAVGKTVHDLRYLRDLRRMMFGGAALKDCHAMERRIRIAVDARDERWMKEFMTMITTNSISQTAIQKSARVVSTVRRTEECNGNDQLTRKALKKICISKHADSVPHAANSTWSKIHKLAGSDELPEK